MDPLPPNRVGRHDYTHRHGHTPGPLISVPHQAQDCRIEGTATLGVYPVGWENREPCVAPQLNFLSSSILSLSLVHKIFIFWTFHNYTTSLSLVSY